jgi:hypothetical protein
MLVERFSSSETIEASSAVIGPALAWKVLPRTRAAFLRRITRNTPKKPTVSRARARAFFILLTRSYGEDIIGRAIDSVVRTRCSSPVIVSGVRGGENARFLAARGFIVAYLDVPATLAAKRLAKRDGIPETMARKEIADEEDLFGTSGIKRSAQVRIKPGRSGHVPSIILKTLSPRECARCVNTVANPSIRLDARGLCQVCAGYACHFNARSLAKERRAFLRHRGKRGSDGRYDVMVGISGGKDSTATLAAVKALGFTPLAFTLDSGYYPMHIFPRAKAVARRLGIDHVRIDIRGYARPVDLASFALTARLYDGAADGTQRESASKAFRAAYAEGRKHYSARCTHALPFVRSCQLCRRLVIRAYHAEAAKRGITLVVLGMNEWAGLAHGRYTGLRVLQPRRNGPATTVAHFPFLFQRTIADTKKTLRSIGWHVPRGESFIESNANSCLFARAAETTATRLLGFHPDSTRLAREVTAGFITKAQARAALGRRHESRKTVREVLEGAGILHEKRTVSP